MMAPQTRVAAHLSFSRKTASYFPRPRLRSQTRDSLSFPTVMGCPSTGSIRSLASRTLLVLLTLISTLDAAETNVCTVAANPSGFDHRQVTLKGIVAGLSKEQLHAAATNR